jgi:hypothetical protein
MFARNIDNAGRLIRGWGAVLLAAVGFLALQVHIALTCLIWAGSAFMLFEAVRGWCALRACGIKTKY